MAMLESASDLTAISKRIHNIVSVHSLRSAGNSLIGSQTAAV